MLPALALDLVDRQRAVVAPGEVGRGEEPEGGGERLLVVRLEAGGQVQLEVGPARAVAQPPDQAQPLAGHEEAVAEIRSLARQRLGEGPRGGSLAGIQILVPVANVGEEERRPAGRLVFRAGEERREAPVGCAEVIAEHLAEQRAGEALAQRGRVQRAAQGALVKALQSPPGGLDLAGHERALAPAGPAEDRAEPVVGEEAVPVPEARKERHQRPSGTRKSAPSGAGGPGSATASQVAISSRRSLRNVSTAARRASSP